jgi:hypothetical protein
MVAMVVLYGTRIRYTRLLVHLISGDLASDVEEGRELFCCFCHEMVGLVSVYLF